MPEQAHLLDVEKIVTVGFVPAGANPEADILLFKARKDQMSDVNAEAGAVKRFVSALAKGLGLSKETEAEILKEVDMVDGTPTVEELQAQLGDVQKKLDAQTAELSATKDALEKAQAAPAPDPEPEEKLEKTLEGADPVIKQHLEALQKSALESQVAAKAAQDEVAKLRQEQQDARFETIAKSLPDIADVDDKQAFVSDLYKGLGDEKADKYLSQLRKSQALADQAGVFKEWGSDAQPVEEGQALSALEKQAADLAKSEGISVPQAFAKVLDNPNNKDLYNQYVRENRSH